MKKQAEEMNKKIFGPVLFCEYCGETEVLSPCFYCQSEAIQGKDFCRGCGEEIHNCEEETEICEQESETRRALIAAILEKYKIKVYTIGHSPEQVWENYFDNQGFECRELEDKDLEKALYTALDTNEYDEEAFVGMLADGRAAIHGLLLNGHQFAIQDNT